MQVIDDDTLARFRLAGHCDLCKGYFCRLDPHHILRKGIGGGGQIDAAANILGLCRTCHDLVHEGRIPEGIQYECAERREGIPIGSAKPAMLSIRRLPKETPEAVWRELLPRRNDGQKEICI